MLLIDKGLGHNPNMVPYETIGAIWTKDSGSYHDILSDYVEPNPDPVPKPKPIKKLNRFLFTFSEAGLDENDGYLTIDLLDLTMDEKKLLFKNKLKTDIITLGSGNTSLEYIMLSKHYNLDLNKVDNSLTLLNFSFSNGNDKYFVSSLKLNQAIDINTGSKEKMSQQTMSIINLPINAGKVEVQPGDIKPDILDVLVTQDELSGILAKQSSDDMSENFPNSFKLYQNYPNPFNPVTAINFDLPEPSKAKLIIVDVMGREVKTLVNDTMNAGQHLIFFDGSSLSTGIYFYVLQAGKYREAKKMTLIK